jgi:hypothetical protein
MGKSLLPVNTLIAAVLAYIQMRLYFGVEQQLLHTTTQW